MIDVANFELFVFDLDGTLLDSIDDLTDALNLALTDVGCDPVDKDIIKTKLCLGTKNLLGDLVGDDPALTQSIYVKYIERYRERMFHNSPLYPGVLELLDGLSGQTTMAILTNKREEPAVEILSHYAIDHHFELVIGGDSLEEKKPSPAPLLHICETLKIEPKKTLMIGDSHADILSGQGAGTSTLGVLNGFTTRDMLLSARPDHVIDSIDVLARLVQNT